MYKRQDSIDGGVKSSQQKARGNTNDQASEIPQDDNVNNGLRDDESEKQAGGDANEQVSENSREDNGVTVNESEELPPKQRTDSKHVKDLVIKGPDIDNEFVIDSSNKKWFTKCKHENHKYVYKLNDNYDDAYVALHAHNRFKQLEEKLSCGFKRVYNCKLDECSAWATLNRVTLNPNTKKLISKRKTTHEVNSDGTEKELPSQWLLTACLQHDHDPPGPNCDQLLIFENETDAQLYNRHMYEPETSVFSRSNDDERETEERICRTTISIKEEVKERTGGNCSMRYKIRPLISKRGFRISRSLYYCIDGNLYHSHQRKLRDERVPIDDRNEMKRLIRNMIPSSKVLLDVSKDVPLNDTNARRQIARQMVYDAKHNYAPEFKRPGVSEEKGILIHFNKYYIRHLSKLSTFFKVMDEESIFELYPNIRDKMVETPHVNILLMTNAMLSAFELNPTTVLIDGEYFLV